MPIEYEPVSTDPLSVCPVCGSVVPEAKQADHTTWHDSLVIKNQAVVQSTVAATATGAMRKVRGSEQHVRFTDPA